MLRALGIEYMVTGSYASSMQGAPRSTHDLDLVVALPDEASSARLAAAFPAPDFYVDRDAVRAAVRSRRMFNVLDARTGEKVDFWLLTDEAFDRSRFARRRAEALPGGGPPIDVSRSEDTILMKLCWTKLAGGSEKHFTDALRVGPLEIEALWVRLKAEAQVL